MFVKRLVIVESPTKARTLKKFLGSDYNVLHCMGHIRDLPKSTKEIPANLKKEPWSQLGVNVTKDFEPIYLIPANKKKIVSELKSALKEADELILATDEDREGESISWHLLEVLKPKVPFHRMVFHEITKKAILEALGKFREIDHNLVEAQECRRILDRLVGYTLSPILWKKVAYGLSAGRVQSVALKLVTEKELQRISFESSHYKSFTLNFDSPFSFEARSVSIDGEPFVSSKDFDSTTGALKKKNFLHVSTDLEAEKIQKKLRAQKWWVKSIEVSEFSRKPSPPFITSTLQQEGSRRLNLAVRETMKVAQSLYEKGFITYMRTDSTFLSAQALEAARTSIKTQFGKEYLPETPKNYQTKSKGAQEAHEAIRPAGDTFAHPSQTGLKGVFADLYELIWKRTLASQMINSKEERTQIKLISDTNSEASLSGVKIKFAGFRKLYLDSLESVDKDKDGQLLPDLKEGQKLECSDVVVKGHDTKPPARYTEASLVQILEKEGVGRPSTYASILNAIQARGYVVKEKNQLLPSLTALIVSQFLRQHFPDYVDLQFTSNMEEDLDVIAQGNVKRNDYLGQIYSVLHKKVEEKKSQIEGSDSRSIELKSFPGFVFKVGRYGAYVCKKDKSGQEVCGSLPEGESLDKFSQKFLEDLIENRDGRPMGKDPDSGKTIYFLRGRYGPYVQLGKVSPDYSNVKDLKRASVGFLSKPDEVTLEQCTTLLKMPLLLGHHPESKKKIEKNVGRFGPYVVCDGDFRSIPKVMNFFEVEFSEALELLNKPKGQRFGVKVLRTLGEHPSKKKKIIEVCDGKYGFYIKMGSKNVSLPESQNPEKITLKEAAILIDGAPDKKKKAKKDSARKTTANKTAVQKTTVKKVIVRKKNVQTKEKN